MNDEYVIYDIRDKQIIKFFDSLKEAQEGLSKFADYTKICSLEEWNERYQDIVNDEKF